MPRPKSSKIVTQISSTSPSVNAPRPVAYIERPEPLTIMDELESMVLQEGWPVPLSPYYVIHHQRLLGVIDRLRASLQEEMDERFLQAFSAEFQSPQAMPTQYVRSR